MLCAHGRMLRLRPGALACCLWQAWTPSLSCKGPGRHALGADLDHGASRKRPQQGSCLRENGCWRSAWLLPSLRVETGTCEWCRTPCEMWRCHARLADVAGAAAVSKGLRTALYALVTLGLLGSWLIALSGVSSLQKICHTPGFGGCRQQLGLQWWVIWFEFVTILITLAVQVTSCLHKNPPVKLQTCQLSTANCMPASLLIRPDPASWPAVQPSPVGRQDLHHRLPGHPDHPGDDPGQPGPRPEGHQPSLYHPGQLWRLLHQHQPRQHSHRW